MNAGGGGSGFASRCLRWRSSAVGATCAAPAMKVLLRNYPSRPGRAAQRQTTSLPMCGLCGYRPARPCRSLCVPARQASVPPGGSDRGGPTHQQTKPPNGLAPFREIFRHIQLMPEAASAMSLHDRNTTWIRPGNRFFSRGIRRGLRQLPARRFCARWCRWHGVARLYQRAERRGFPGLLVLFLVLVR